MHYKLHFTKLEKIISFLGIVTFVKYIENIDFNFSWKYKNSLKMCIYFLKLLNF